MTVRGLRTVGGLLRRPRALLAVGLAIAGAAGMGWLRDSSLVAVEHVSVTGATGRSAPAVRAALARAGRSMTTLHIRDDELRQAVEPYPLIKDVRVSRDMPHRLRVRVIEHAAVAVVLVGARPVPVAGDGTLLREARSDPDLPAVTGRPTVVDDRVVDRRTRESVTLLARAPRALRPLVSRVRRDPAGLHARLKSGPRLDFGRAARLRAKWVAAARVLADPRAAGAAYVDLRVPERPVAGPFPHDPVPPPPGTLPAPVPAAPGPEGEPDA